MDIEPRRIERAADQLPDTLDVDVIVFPRERDGERGLYHDSTITMVKELRLQGVTARYEHPQPSRGWIGEKALTPDIVSFFVGIASSAGWDGLLALLRLRPPAREMTAKIARYRDDASGTLVEVIELKGDGGDVISAIKRLRAEGDTSSDDEGS